MKGHIFTIINLSIHFGWNYMCVSFKIYDSVFTLILFYKVKGYFVTNIVLIHMRLLAIFSISYMYKYVSCNHYRHKSKVNLKWS